MKSVHLEKKKELYLFFPRTPLSSLAMSAWISSLITENSRQDIEIILALPNLRPDLLNLILLPWSKLNFRSFYFNYDSLNYYPGVLGFSASSSVKLNSNKRLADLDRVLRDLNFNLAKFNFSFEDINNFCFTSEHPILLHNKLRQSQNVFYFEHGFGDYAIFLYIKHWTYQLYTRTRTYLESKLFQLYRSNLNHYSYVSIFCSELCKPLFNETFIQDYYLNKTLNQVRLEIINFFYNENLDIDFQNLYFLVSLDQIEFFAPDDLEKFITLIYKDFIERSNNYVNKPFLLIKPREDTSYAKLIELKNIIKKICTRDTIIFSGLEKLHLSSELICILFNVQVVYTHGYTISAFLGRLNLWPFIVNLNNFYETVFNIKFYYKSELKSLRSFKRHHNMIKSILRKHQTHYTFSEIRKFINE